CLTPVPVGRDRNRDLAELGPQIRATVPEGREVVSFDLQPHWRYASPLYFYGHRLLTHPVTDPAELRRLLAGGNVAAVLARRPTLDRLEDLPLTVVASSGDLVLLAPPG
ncbi:MAG: hypothetical protein ACYTDX_10885, partial [Planctomycetota bacterium]